MDHSQKVLGILMMMIILGRDAAGQMYVPSLDSNSTLLYKLSLPITIHPMRSVEISQRALGNDSSTSFLKYKRNRRMAPKKDSSGKFAEASGMICSQPYDGAYTSLAVEYGPCGLSTQKDDPCKRISTAATLICQETISAGTPVLNLEEKAKSMNFIRMMFRSSFKGKLGQIGLQQKEDEVSEATFEFWEENSSKCSVLLRRAIIKYSNLLEWTPAQKTARVDIMCREQAVLAVEMRKSQAYSKLEVYQVPTDFVFINKISQASLVKYEGTFSSMTHTCDDLQKNFVECTHIVNCFNIKINALRNMQLKDIVAYHVRITAQGYAIFASKDLRSNTLLGEYAGLIVPTDSTADQTFRVEFFHDKDIDAKNEGNLLRYLNSRCVKFNSQLCRYVANIEDHQYYTVVVKIITNVQANTEICLNYRSSINDCSCPDCPS